MRVLLAAPSLQVGGAERLVVSLARELTLRGDVVAVSGPSGPLEEILPPGTVRLPLPERGRALGGVAQHAWRLGRFASRFAPDVIHAHNVKVTAVALLAKALAAPSRPPVVATFHGVVPAEYRRAARILRRADAVACVSRELRDRAVAAGVPPARASVVPNAVEPSPPLNAAKRAALEAELALDARPLIVSVGRLVPEKAHHRLLDAVALLVGEGTPVRLLIVGEGPLGAALHRQVARLGLQEAVTLTGLRHDARDLIARADLVALTSDSEGLPLVVLEALGAGVPVVSTAVPGTTELLSSGAGTVVGDFTAEAVARALSQVLGDPALRERQGEEGRRLVATRHSLAAMVEGYRDLYRTVVSGAPRRARRVRPNARP